MRRFIVPLVVLIGALALTACGGEDGGGGGAGGGDYQPCDLMVTEIMNFPSGTLTGNEWIELHNPTNAAIDLKDVWIRTDEDARLWMLADLAGPVLIQPGEYFLIWQVKKDEPVALSEDGAFRVLYLPEDLFDLKKWDLTVTLRTLDGTVLHAVTVGPEGSACDPASPTIAPLSTETDGASLELQAGFLGCADSTLKCDAWAPAWKNGLIPNSSDRGTPGQGPEAKPVGAPPTPGSLAVTEIMSASGEACGKVDWFELLNLSANALSLEGCTFGDGTASGDTIVKSPIIVPANGYAVLAAADMDGVTESGLLSGPNLNKTGDTLYLVCGGAKIFEVAYGGGEGELPKPKDGMSIGVCFDGLVEPYTVTMLHDPVVWAVTEAGASGCGDDVGSPGMKNILCNCDAACPPGACGGDDGCGGICGCGEMGTCVEGQCICDGVPDCTNRECGGDGCGGSCGTCAAGLSCAEGAAGAWCARTPTAGEVAPTEIMSNGGDACGKIDWFELKNLSMDALDLEGCTVGDDSASGTHVFSGALVIPAGGEIVIAGADMAGVTEDYITTKPNLNQSNERIWLDCPDGAGGVINLFEVWYGTGTAGDLPSTSKGVSIQVCPDSLPNPATLADYVMGANWQLTAAAATGCGDDLGTPGMPNPYCACDPACPPGQCGAADGCGGICGCGENQVCEAGQCVCEVTPDCTDKACGDDGCGGSCGICNGQDTCLELDSGSYCVLAPTPGDLVVTEIRSNTPSPCDGVDWFELLNFTGSDISLKNCVIGDDSASGEHTIGEAAIVPAGGYAVLASDTLGDVDVAYYFSKPNLNQTGDSIYLRCPDSMGVMSQMFWMHYGSDVPNPGDGASVGYCPNLGPAAPDAMDYLTAEHWGLSTAGAYSCGADIGSPGLANPNCDVTCEPECAAPACGGPDGCGGTCGCPMGQACIDGTCEGICQADCDGKVCGDDGCGGDCGTCELGLDCIEGACLAAPAYLVINEVNANISGGCDLVELRVLTAGSLGGVVLKERSSTVATLPAVDVDNDEIIVVHFDGGDANCNPMAALAETTSVSEFDALTYGTTYDSAWDVFVDDSGLTATDNVLTLYGPGGDIFDAVFLTDADDGGDAASGTESAAATVADAGEWTDPDGTVPDGGYVDSAFNASAVEGLKDTGDSATGETLQRFDNWDTDTNEDWTLWIHSWGFLNDGQ